MGILEFLKQSIKSYGAQGYDENGYDRQGYDRNGYDESGYNREGYDQDGYDKNGFHRETHLNRDGFDCDGFDAQGYDRDGYDSDGYNKDGFDRQERNRDGYDRNGYDYDGYDQKGFDADGYDRSGFNAAGIDRDGYNAEGFDSDGYDRRGFNRKGYDRDGFKSDGYNRYGYDRAGFNREGFSKEGYNREGFNKKGYDRDGYDASGFNKKGYDRDGYDRNGYNEQGFDRNGFDANGYNSNGYDVNGFDAEGFTAEGISYTGHPRNEYVNGYHVNTQRDPFGYDRRGYNEIGINKHTQLDRFGFDETGVNKDGFSIWGIHPDTGLCIDGTRLDEDNAMHLTEQDCAQFRKLYYRFMGGDESTAIELANCYGQGIGTICDANKMSAVLLIAAVEFSSQDALDILAQIAEEVEKQLKENHSVSDFLKKLAGGETQASFYQFKAGQAIKFTHVVNEKESAIKEETLHLEMVLRAISDEIQREKYAITPQDSETWWMDKDQRGYWKEINFRNQDRYSRIRELEDIQSNPYYARFDLAGTGGSKETFYIGEQEFYDGNKQHQIVSVWSEVGRAYRATRNTSVNIKGRTYDVQLRRKIDIYKSFLTDIFDEYVAGSEASSANITDPYLLRILEQKRGEKNITNIIRTIQENQNDIIEEPLSENIIVQGCAGSGKTMILLHRLANLKYNNPHIDWKSVKIITPNPGFSLYIDELSKNLKINSIERLTLGEYYYSVIDRYSNFASNPERKNKAASSNRRAFLGGSEQYCVRADVEYGIDAAAIIYSDLFKKSLKKLTTEWTTQQEAIGFDDAAAQFEELFFAALGESGKEETRSDINYLCVLYAKALYLYYVFGPLSRPDMMLCIDEGQDICENQYLLLRDINSAHKSLCFNIFGDLAQRIPGNVNLSSWEGLSDALSAKYYTLNENFRNSQEIIDYYNQSLQMNDKAFGLRVKKVSGIEPVHLLNFIRLQVLLKNRTALIVKDPETLPLPVRGIAKSEPYSRYLSVLSVQQAKGLEFDTAFVIDAGMDHNEKYIAYSRALSELYIVIDAGEEEPDSVNLPDVQPKGENSPSDSPIDCGGCDEKEDSALLQEPNSISDFLQIFNKNNLLIVRTSWTNDFCFKISEVNGDRAFGVEYLNGEIYRKTSFGIHKKEWILYSGRSKDRILDGEDK